jgi:hypothetical protein
VWAAVALLFGAAPVGRALAQSQPPAPAAAPAARPKPRKAAVLPPEERAKVRRQKRAARDTALAATRARTGADTLWPVRGLPAPLPGSVLPAKRILAYYGNPLSKKMGILGEIPPEQMLARLDRETAEWNAADPSHPVQPALQLIASVAQGTPGKDGMYRYRVVPALIDKVYGWAHERGALLFLDVQIGKSSLEDELKPLLPYLQRPDVHLAIDPEFAMTRGGLPGKRVGTYDAADVNYAVGVLAGLVTQYRLPPKVLVVHRFTGPMVTNALKINNKDPRVQVVMNMDGWGPPYGKRATWSRFIYPYPVQYTGFKLFYHNDTKAGHPLMRPHDVLGLQPKPLYIQYQ